MKKANKFLALILTAILLFNSVNYEVIADEVSEQIQKYKVMRIRKIIHTYPTMQNHDIL